MGTQAAICSGIWGESDTQIPWEVGHVMPWAAQELPALINLCCGSDKSAGGKWFISFSSHRDFPTALSLPVCPIDEARKG